MIRRLNWLLGCLALLAVGTMRQSDAAEFPSTALSRVANQTLKFPPAFYPSQFFTVDAVEGLTFNKPVAVTSPPGETNRLFVIERQGRVVVLTHLSQPTRTVFLDISAKVFSDYEKHGAEGLTSLAFHPDYRNNGYFFVTYKTQLSLRGSVRVFERLARFRVSTDDPNRADPSSEVEFLSQLDEGTGHSWNDLQFGPDGYLYLAAGDEGEPQDAYQNSNRIDKDFYSAILRIDIDRRPGNLRPNPLLGSSAFYSVPRDNPFVGATSYQGEPVDPTKVRTELYAIGFRNPWRISFDPVTGWLYCADVGQYLVEEINLVQKGGNYGWAYFEGTKKGFRGDPPAPFQSIAPIHEYPHFGSNQIPGPDQGNSVTGGIVYRGARIPELHDFYVFADYLSGNIWALRYDGNRVVSHFRVAFEQGIAGFGRDPRNGDVLLVNHSTGKIRTLQYAPRENPLPQTLSETGIFRDLIKLDPHDGIVPYSVNVPFWSDNAIKRRWFSVPGENPKFGFRSDSAWSIPEGTVLIKHFELNLHPGVDGPARRLETRVLVRQKGGVYGLTYRWNDAGTDAVLVPPEGQDAVYPVQEGGTVREQAWRFPSRYECQLCHTAAANYILGFNTAQFNGDQNYGLVTTNQIIALRDAGYLENAPPTVHSLRALARIDDESVSREYRVRSYLAVNCAQCHQPGGTARGSWDARIHVPTLSAAIIEGDLNNVEGHSGNKVIKPKSVEQSMILSRMTRIGPGRMPPLASTLIDQRAVALLTAWVTQDLKTFKQFWQWQNDYFGSASLPQAQAEADPDADGASNYLEYLTGTQPLSASDRWSITIQSTNHTPQIFIPQPANRGVQVEVTRSLSPPFTWRLWDSDQNRLLFPSSNTVLRLIDTNAVAPRFYRGRLVQP